MSIAERLVATGDAIEEFRAGTTAKEGLSSDQVAQLVMLVGLDCGR
jgi:hypothetical protein